MREPDLRSVLLVKAIEETDRDGTVVAPADRLAAAQEAKRALPPDGATLRLEAGRLPVPAQRLLARRASTMLRQIRVRHPVVDEVLSFSPAAWLALAVLVAAFAIGIGVSALDGTRRINVLAFPLWGLVAWNLAVYVWVLVSWMRGLSRGKRAPRWLPAWAADAAMQRLSDLIVRTRRFHTSLAEALARFVAEWQQVSRPILAARAARLFHLAAAVLGVGIIAGFYLRGLVLDYQAGWESTFLDAERARAVLRVIYAPASWITGIPVPDAAHLEAIRWRDGAGGENAAPWIHLLAATALLFIMVPRLLLAIAASVAILEASRSAPMPTSLAAYFDAVFRDVGVTVSGDEVRVVPYAYEPSPESIARLREALRGSHAHASVDVRPAVAYGHEDAFSRALHEADASPLVLLFTMAATPEEENHGRVLEAAREAARRGATALDVVVDEGPYASRLGPDMKDRVDERRRAWRQFVAQRALEARFLDLSR